MEDSILINPKYTKVLNSEHNQFEIAGMANTTEFLQTIKRKLGHKTGILPKNCIYFEEFLDSNELLYIIEEQPKIRTVFFNFDSYTMIEQFLNLGYPQEFIDSLNLKNNSCKFSLRLALPFVLFAIWVRNDNQYINTKVFFRQSETTSLLDQLFRPCLTNLSNELNLCHGQKFYHRTFESHNELCQEVINSFWFSNFNYDYNYNIAAYQKNSPQLHNFFTWAYYTAEEPNFILKTKLLESEFHPTISSLISTRKQNEEDVFDHLFQEILNSCKSNKIYKLQANYKQEGGKDTKFISFYNGLRLYDSNDSVSSVAQEAKLTIGEEIIINNEKFYIKSFLRNNSGNSHKYDIIGLILENQNGEEKIVDSPKEFKTICNQIKEENIKNLNVYKHSNGEEFFVGDVLIDTNTSRHFRLEKIIKLSDGTHHLKIGTSFYLNLVFNTKRFKKIEEILVNGIKLEKGKKYEIYRTWHASSKLELLNHKFFMLKTILSFSDFIINSYGELCCVFLGDEKNKNGDKQEFIYSLQDFSNYLNITEICDKQDEELIWNQAYRYHDCLIVDYPKPSIYLNKKQKFFQINSSQISFETFYDYDDCKKYFDNVDKTISIPSFDRDFNLSVGDEVIIIDWKTPNTMLKIRTVEGFSSTESHFLVNTISKDNENYDFDLVDYKKNRCKFANIRKVCHELNGIKVGEKCCVNNTDVKEFYKKDIHTICAFIIDEEEPLVLLSNYRTQYLNSFKENFNIIPENSKRLKQDISDPNNLHKIQIQSGDLFKNESSSYVVCRDAITLSTKVLILPKIHRDISKPGFDIIILPLNESSLPQHLRYGILYPRYDLIKGKSESDRQFGTPSIYNNCILKPTENQLGYFID